MKGTLDAVGTNCAFCPERLDTQGRLGVIPRLVCSDIVAVPSLCLALSCREVSIDDHPNVYTQYVHFACPSEAYNIVIVVC
jgi:hypothetical protein